MDERPFFVGTLALTKIMRQQYDPPTRDQINVMDADDLRRVTHELRDDHERLRDSNEALLNTLSETKFAIRLRLPGETPLESRTRVLKELDKICPP